MVIEAAINVSINTDFLFNTREVTISFLEEVGGLLGKYLVKKHPEMIQKIIDAGFKIAAESEEEYGDDEDSTHDLALIMLEVYACEVPDTIIYPIFKQNISMCVGHSDPLVKKAGIRVLGDISDGDALLDCIKEDVDVWTDILVQALQDKSSIVQDAASFSVGDFSENVIPDFLDNHDKVMPALLTVIQ